MALLPLTTYAGLQSAVLRWMDDPTIADEVPELITLSEKRLSRRLNTPEMEASTTLSLTDGSVALPDDLMALRAVFIDYQGVRNELQVRSEADFNAAYQTDYTGRPSTYTVSGLNLMVSPLPDLVYPVSVTYKQFLPALSDANPTNWLLTKHPDLYLAHVLLTAVDYGYETDRTDWAVSKVENLLVEVNEAGRKIRYGDGPLTARAPVGDANVGRFAYYG